MQHFGDITKLSGYDLPTVDVIVGGSPCQDLSVAGKRVGLDGERSGLFVEQIRIVKEMRERDVRSGRSGYMVRPRYLIWENVPGAFSSNGGEDFRIVLEEICKVAEQNAVVPRPEKKWSSSGAIMGDGWSVAWRVHDAQFWGVPQRRKRISLVADFGGFSAPEILFERKGLSRDPQPCGTERKGTPERTEGGFGETGQGYWQRGIQTIRAEGENRPSRPSNVICEEPIPIHDQATRYAGKRGSKQDGKGNGLGIGESGDPSPTLSSGDHHVVFDAYQHHGWRERDISGPMTVGQNNTVRGDTPLVKEIKQSARAYAVDCRNASEDECINGTLQSKEQGYNTNSNNIVRVEKHEDLHGKEIF